MTDEPYRWLEAISNRREYIREQLKGATPVFAVSRKEGVLLAAVGTGQSKVFEIYDRIAIAALGHPVDIEKVRQTMIEAAHLEGFARDPEDVTVRRLVNFSLSPALKTGFEQIFAAPIIVESLLAELSDDPSKDVLAKVSFDGRVDFVQGGVAVAHTSAADESAARDWLKKHLPDELSLRDVVERLLAAWGALSSGGPFTPPSLPGAPFSPSEGRTVELGLLDRHAARRAKYRTLPLVS